MTDTFVISGRDRDLGGFSVRRILPAPTCRHIGPFVFWDHLGPATFAPGQGIDVRPHPHIGLSTVTYLFDGSLRHRDSLGSALDIEPGDVNWMVSGRGIVHSERTPPDARQRGSTIHGIQSWVALPSSLEESEPSFHHYDASALPRWEEEPGHFTLIAGSYGTRQSPVKTASPLFYLDVQPRRDGSLKLTQPLGEWGIYCAQGSATGAFGKLVHGDLLVGRDGVEPPSLNVTAASRILFFGGEAFPETRHIWWNFVSTRADRIDRAKDDWDNGRFSPVPGESEFIPLPKS